MSERARLLLLEDMPEAALKIKRYTNGLDYNAFLEDDKTIDATVRNFEIIGEAANKLDDDFKIQHSGIDWNRMRGFRNRIVHHYFGIDNQIVWTIIENDLDSLINQLKELTEDYPDE